VSAASWQPYRPAVRVSGVSKLSGGGFSNLFEPPAKGSVAVPSRCPTPDPFTGSNCKRRRCSHCGKGWVASWEAITRLNIGALGGRVVLISLTAPGADRLPWSCAKDHRHAGSRGCRVKSDDADVWAEHAPDNWRRLRDAARLAVKRADLPTAALVLERVWEPQQRGVPHLHVVTGARTPLELAAAERFHAELMARAPEYGFGPQLHVTRPMEAREAARYLAGYLLGRSRKKGTIRANLGDPRMPSSLIWITPAIGSISRGERMVAWRERLGLKEGTGLTMRRLRYARWYLAAVQRKVLAYPRLFGEEMLAVAKVAVLLERSNGPPPSERFDGHVRTLRLMRQLEAA
jgi:hypothetical protein